MISFKKKTDEVEVEITILHDHMPWTEVAEQFVCFLQASGYIVTSDEVGQHLTDDWGESND